MTESFDELALRVWDEAFSESQKRNIPFAAEFARRLRAAWTAQQEPVAWVDWSKPNGIRWLAQELGLPDGCSLYAFPPDAAAEVERLTVAYQAALNECKIANKHTLELKAEVERLTKVLEDWKTVAESAKVRAQINAERFAIAEAEVNRLQSEIDRCHARLEIDRIYKSGERVAVPYEDRQTIPDGISCRDETIKLQDATIRRLEAELAAERDARNKLERGYYGDEICDRAERTERVEAGLASLRSEIIKDAALQVFAIRMRSEELDAPDHGVSGWLQEAEAAIRALDKPIAAKGQL